MKITTIINGRTSLCITPETEIEKQILAELFKGEVVCTMQEKLQILDKALVDSVVISPSVNIVKKE